MFNRPTCVDCRSPAPETNTYYTLIGPTFSWRMVQLTRGDGSVVVEWRCAACWRKYKGRASGSRSPGRGPAGSSRPLKDGSKAPR